MIGLSRRQQQLIREWGPAEAAARARKKAEAERAAAADARLLAEVEQQMTAEREAHEAEAAMSDAERTERRLRAVELEKAGGVQAVLVKQPPRPRGWVLAREAVAAKWRREEDERREQHERDLGVPQAQAKWDERHQAIEDARARAIHEAREKCIRSEQAAREKAESDLEAIGGRPTLNDYEQR